MLESLFQALKNFFTPAGEPEPEEFYKILKEYHLLNYPLYRNEVIKAEYQKLRGTRKSKELIPFLADKYFLSTKSVEGIIYNYTGKRVKNGKNTVIGKQFIL